MPPGYPIPRVLEGNEHRVTLPKEYCPSWLKDKTEVILLPLWWRESLLIDSSKSLEALVLCRPDELDNQSSWRTWPREIEEKAKEGDEDFIRLAALIYPATVNQHKRSFRVMCPPTLSTLTFPQREVLIVPDSMGLTIWTPQAFQIHHGELI